MRTVGLEIFDSQPKKADKPNQTQKEKPKKADKPKEE